MLNVGWHGIVFEAMSLLCSKKTWPRRRCHATRICFKKINSGHKNLVLNGECAMVRFRFVFVLVMFLCVSAVQGKVVRTLELYGFDTPLMGKLDPSYPGTGCEGRLERTAQAAHDGTMGGRLFFKIPKGSDGLVTWNYALPIPIREGAKSFSIWVRTNHDKGKILFQLRDSEGWILSGQTPPPVGQWTKITLDLDKADYEQRKEKKPAWPIFLFTVGMIEGRSEGYLDIDSLSVTTEAPEAVQPGYVVELGTAKLGNLFRPGESPDVRLYIRNQEGQCSPVFQGEYRVSDWQDKTIRESKLNDLTVPAKSVVGIPILLKDLKQSGAFCLTAQIKPKGAASKIYTVKGWFGILPEGKVNPVRWVGTVAHWNHGWGMGEEAMMQMLDVMNAAGIGAIKTGAHWPNIERGPGKFRSVESLDRYIAELKKRGMVCSLTLSHANSHYANPLDPEGFARFAAWAVKYYQDTDRFEIWNEAGNTGFKKQYGDAKTRAEEQAQGIPWVNKFVEFTNTAVKAMKTARPKAVIYVGAEDVCYYMQHMIDKGIGTGADGLAIHVYPHELRPETSDYIGDGLKDLRERSRKKGGPVRVIITESGWSTCTCEWAKKIVTTTYADQANYLVRMFLVSRAANVDYALNYDFMNDGSKPDDKESNFGMVHDDYSPKPGFMAIAAMTRIIGNGKFVKNLSTNPEKYRIYFFDVNGKSVLAAWAVQGKSNVMLDVGADRVEILDLMGNLQTVSVQEKKMKITLTESPVYLRGGKADFFNVRPGN